MAYKKEVWVSIDEQEFDTEIEATKHDFCVSKASMIQELICDEKFNECLDWAPADFALWVSENFTSIQKIIET